MQTEHVRETRKRQPRNLLVPPAAQKKSVFALRLKEAGYNPKAADGGERGVSIASGRTGGGSKPRGSKPPPSLPRAAAAGSPSPVLCEAPLRLSATHHVQSFSLRRIQRLEAQEERGGETFAAAAAAAAAGGAAGWPFSSTEAERPLSMTSLRRAHCHSGSGMLARKGRTGGGGKGGATAAAPAPVLF